MNLKYEKQIVMETLQASRSIREAARRLGVSHTAVLNKMKSLRGKPRSIILCGSNSFLSQQAAGN